jgi:anti-sigma factor RsiW
MNNAHDEKKLGFWQCAQVSFLSAYCACAIVGPLYFAWIYFDNLFSEAGADEKRIFGAVLLAGIMGSAVRGIARLFTDVGKRQYTASWRLSILMRPLEGAAIAFVAYLATKAGIILLERGHPSSNGAGYLFIGVLSGMFSHRAADALRGRFDALWGPRVGKDTKPSTQSDTGPLQPSTRT